MNREDLLTAKSIGKTHLNPSIEAAWSCQRRIQNINSVGGCQENHAGVFSEAIHLREQLIQGLLTLVIATANAGTALTTDGIDLIDEHDAGRLLLGFFEQITNPAGSDTHKQLNKFRRRHREKWDLGLPGNGSGQQRFSGSRWSDQKNTTWDFCAKTNEGFRLLQKGHDLLELLLGLVDASDILEPDLKIVLRFDPRLAAAETKCSIGDLGGTAQQKGEPDDDQKDQREIADQSRHGLFLAGIANLQGDSGFFSRSQDLLVIGEDRNGQLASIGINRLHFTSRRNQLKGFDLALFDLLQQG